MIRPCLKSHTPETWVIRRSILGMVSFGSLNPSFERAASYGPVQYGSGTHLAVAQKMSGGWTSKHGYRKARPVPKTPVKRTDCSTSHFPSYR